MRALALLLLAAALVTPALAADETARSILDARKALDDGARRWRTRRAELTLTITDRDAGAVTRGLVAYQRRAAGERATSAFVTAPADMEGTAFLAVARDGRPTEEWSYDPTRPETRAITAADVKTRVAGSDLTFADLDVLGQMLFWTDADAQATLRGVENVDSVAAYAIELVPLRADVPYKRVLVWIGRDDMVVREVQLFEGDGVVATRRIEVTRVRDEGAIPWIETIEVSTPRAGTRTRIDLSRVVFNPKLDADLFTPKALERGVP